MADKKLKDRSDEMEHDLQRLEDHITDAERQLQARRRDADDRGEATAGDEPTPAAEADRDSA